MRSNNRWSAVKNASLTFILLIAVLGLITPAMALSTAEAKFGTSRARARSITTTSDALVLQWNEITTRILPNGPSSTAAAPPLIVAANDQVPFKALMLGSAAFTDPTTAEFQGSGHATHLGLFTFGGVALLSPSTGSCPGGPNVPNVHTETLTAANGDELVIQMVNVACPTGPYTYRGIGQWTVLSGTGRFQDVTGQGTNEGHADFEGGTFVMALTGTLSRQ
jgi:hypothetical protein